MSSRPTLRGLRALFPALTRSSYLNAAAASPVSLLVEKAIRDHTRETVEWGDVGFGAWLRRKDETRALVGRLLNASAAEIAFLPSTSLGFGAVARILRERGVREVLTLAGEFPSTTLPLLHAGLRLRVLTPRPDGSYPVEDLEAALGKGTGAVCASAVQYASGYRLDLEAVGRLCRSRGLWFAVNGAQALGQVPVDVARAHVDFLCGLGHKWLMGGYGVGLFYARKDALRGATLPYVGWLSTADPGAMDNLAGARVRRGRGRVFTARGAQFRGEASALEAGSSAWAPLLGFHVALELLLRLGVPAIEAHNAGLQRRLRQRLRALGFTPNTADSRERGSGICVFAVEGDPRQAAAALEKLGVVVSPRGVGLRVSTHAFNTADDVDQLLWAMAKLKLRPPGRPSAPERAARRR